MGVALGVQDGCRVPRGVQDGFRAHGVALGGAQDGSRAMGWPWWHRMGPEHMEWAPGVVLEVQNESSGCGGLLGHRVGPGYLVWPQGRVAAGPVGALGG